MLKLLQTHGRERARESEKEQELCLSPCEPCTLPCTVCMRANKCTLCLHFSVHKDKFACESVVFKACYHGAKQSKSVADWWPPARERNPLGGGGGGEGDIENVDSVYMIQHQDRVGIVGEKSQMVTWTLNELTFEQLRHATHRWFIVWQPRDFSLASLRDVLNTWTPRCI